MLCPGSPGGELTSKSNGTMVVFLLNCCRNWTEGLLPWMRCNHVPEKCRTFGLGCSDQLLACRPPSLPLSTVDWYFYWEVWMQEALQKGAVGIFSSCLGDIDKGSCVTDSHRTFLSGALWGHWQTWIEGAVFQTDGSCRNLEGRKEQWSGRGDHKDLLIHQSFCCCLQE